MSQGPSDYGATASLEHELGFDDVAEDRVPASEKIAKGLRGLTPIVRWAGSKTRLLPALDELIPGGTHRHVEPFLGAATVYLRTAPRLGIGSDINSELVRVYQAVQAQPMGVWGFLSDMPTTIRYYYQLRAADWTQRDAVAQAARFLYLNRFCFNGVYRTNREGQFNVARGRGRLRLPTQEELLAFSRLIQPMELACCDFEQTICRASAGDFLYLDPPYLDPSKRDRGEYGRDVFGTADLARLLSAMNLADRRGVQVLMSYSSKCINRRLLKGWRIRQVEVRRGVASFHEHRKTVSEILVSNY